MSKKSFLLGLGLGLLLATLTLQFDFWKNSSELSQKKMTVDQLREEAKNFGYELKTQNEIDLEIQNAIKSYENEMNSKNSTKPADQKTTGSSNKKDNKSNSTSTNNKQSEKSKYVTIRSGWDATQVAAYLYQQGIVSNKQALVKELIALQKTRKIKTGSFYLEPKSDPKTVARKITNSRP